MGFRIDGMRMGCSCAHMNRDGYRECEVSGDQCVYAFPNAWRCAQEWGEGPCVIPEPDDQFGLEYGNPDIRATFKMSDELIKFLDNEDIEYQKPIHKILNNFEDYTKKDPDKLIMKDKEISITYTTEPNDSELYHFHLDLKG
jgi:hypothetical protein